MYAGWVGVEGSVVWLPKRRTFPRRWAEHRQIAGLEGPARLSYLPGLHEAPDCPWSLEPPGGPVHATAEWMGFSLQVIGSCPGVEG